MMAPETDSTVSASEQRASSEQLPKSEPEQDPANGFVRFMRKIYNPLGFKKGYNFPLCRSLFSSASYLILRFPH